MLALIRASLVLLAASSIPLMACTNIPNSSQSTPTTAITAEVPVETERENYRRIPLEELDRAEDLEGNNPQAIALSAFGNIDAEGGEQNVTVENPQPDREIVTITQTGVADDSIAAIRYRVEFEPVASTTGQRWRMLWAGSQVQCRVGRGHQDWSAELCL